MCVILVSDGRLCGRAYLLVGRVAAKAHFGRAIDRVLEETRDHADGTLHMLKEMATKENAMSDIELKDELLTMVMAGVSRPHTHSHTDTPTETHLHPRTPTHLHTCIRT